MHMCELCERKVEVVTRHHLVPKQKGGTHEPIINLCLPCHKTIHATFSNTELVQRFRTVESLKSAEELQPYLRWIKKRPLEKIAVKKRKR